MHGKVHYFTKYTCPKAFLLFNETAKLSKSNLTNPDFKNFLIKSKNVFKKEKSKFKESVFSLLKNTQKVQIRRDNKMVNQNKKTINKYINILNDAHIDEGIVLNKYFAYLKKYNIEYEKSQQLKLKEKLIPILNQEKMIKDLKKNIKFFKSISNHMIMKYMIENKDKFNQYMNEISTYKSRNTLSNNYRKKTLSTEKNSSLMKTNDTRTILKTYSNNIENFRYNNFYVASDDYLKKNTISNLKLNIMDSPKVSNENIILTQSRDNKHRVKNKKHLTGSSKFFNGSIDVSNKFFTPFKVRKIKINSTENKKIRNENLSSRSDYKTKNYKFNND
jgi:hypothetical protein